jgi:hypothetical protein
VTRGDRLDCADLAGELELDLHPFRLPECDHCPADVPHAQMRGRSACRSDCHILAPKHEARKRRASAGPRQLLREIVELGAPI